MLLVHNQFIAFINGRLGSRACVATLPPEIGRHIGAVTGDVLMGLDYALKLRRKHTLRPEHFYQIQPAIDLGTVGFHRGDLAFLYEERRIWRKSFKLVLKTIPGRDECWIKTFHKLETGQGIAYARRLDGVLRRQDGPIPPKK